MSTRWLRRSSKKRQSKKESQSGGGGSQQKGGGGQSNSLFICEYTTDTTINVNPGDILLNQGGNGASDGDKYIMYYGKVDMVQTESQGNVPQYRIGDDGFGTAGSMTEKEYIESVVMEGLGKYIHGEAGNTLRKTTWAGQNFTNSGDGTMTIRSALKLGVSGAESTFKDSAVEGLSATIFATTADDGVNYILKAGGDPIFTEDSLTTNSYQHVHIITVKFKVLAVGTVFAESGIPDDDSVALSFIIDYSGVYDPIGWFVGAQMNADQSMFDANNALLVAYGMSGNADNADGDADALKSAIEVTTLTGPPFTSTAEYTSTTESEAILEKVLSHRRAGITYPGFDDPGGMTWTMFFDETFNKSAPVDFPVTPTTTETTRELINAYFKSKGGYGNNKIFDASWDGYVDAALPTGGDWPEGYFECLYQIYKEHLKHVDEGE